MNQPLPHYHRFVILGAALVAAMLAILSPHTRAAAQPAAAEKAGDKTSAKPKAEAPKIENAKTSTKTAPKPEPPALEKQTPPKPKPEVVIPAPVSDPANTEPKTPVEKVVAAPTPPSTSAKPLSSRRQGLMAGITIFVLAVFVGFELINKVPTTLHTPLMSGSNAISGITVVGALIAAGQGFHFSSFLGFFAVALAMINVVGGFLVTHRMLLMFKRK